MVHKIWSRERFQTKGFQLKGDNLKTESGRVNFLVWDIWSPYDNQSVKFHYSFKWYKRYGTDKSGISKSESESEAFMITNL